METHMVNATETIERPAPQPSRGALRKRMKDILMLLPNLLKLLLRLVRDPRVSRADKVILGGTILYVIAPLDFIPDMIPFIGQVDDTYLVAISLLRLMSRTDASIVMQHWDGEMDVKRLVDSVIEVATVFLPKPIRHALTARIEVNEPRSLRKVRAAKREAADLGK
jgi:uncharacterized membrane protein YkvA (DUF1232 family)